MPDIEIPVLIVGGSLVGMSTALLLGHHGIRSLAVENHRGTAIHPRAAQISARLPGAGSGGIGHALGQLRAAGLITTTRTGRTHRCQAVLGRDAYLATLVTAALDQAAGPKPTGSRPTGC